MPLPCLVGWSENLCVTFQSIFIPFVLIYFVRFSFQHNGRQRRFDVDKKNGNDVLPPSKSFHGYNSKGNEGKRGEQQGSKCLEQISLKSLI